MQQQNAFGTEFSVACIILFTLAAQGTARMSGEHTALEIFQQICNISGLCQTAKDAVCNT